MADLAALFFASLDPGTRKQAEQTLTQASLAQNFALEVLALALDSTQDRAIRLASGIYFKNTIKRRWSPDAEEDAPPLAEPVKVQLREQLVPAMVALSAPADKPVRAQLAEAVSIIAAMDFPDQWPDLIDRLVQSLSPDDLNQTLTILETAHTIFGPWRSAIASPDLYRIIKYALSRFTEPFFQVFRALADHVLSGATPPENLPLEGQIVYNLLQLYYDLNAQDLPPEFEDSYMEFFAPQSGWFPKFLTWTSLSLGGEPEDTAPSLLSKIKTTVLEIAELFTQRFADIFTDVSVISSFIETVWVIVSSGTYQSVADDAFIAQCMRFLSTTIKGGQYKDLYSNSDSLRTLVGSIVVPNVQLREHDIEQFEDDPLEFIRIDLSFPTSSAGTASFSSSGGGEGTTRRHAAADVIRSLVSSGHDTETTELVGEWVQNGLQLYASNPAENWKAKDSAVFLMSAVAARGSVTAHGVVSANVRVDIVQFFSEHIAQDLQDTSGNVHPILTVDAIRFLYSFRNQLTKDQLLSVLPLLVNHLGSSNYVAYTYAAIAIERILFMKQNKQPLFTPFDVAPWANLAILALLTKIEAGGSPEKVSENDYLMKCIMRIIITARTELAAVYADMMNRLVNILALISKNPSNPNFNQYTFESISALIRFIVPAAPGALQAFEAGLLGPMSFILQEDIDQFVPYTFQILSQLLELNSGPIPAFYSDFLSQILVPQPWTQKGSVPGLVRFIRGFLDKGANVLLQNNQFEVVLGIIQQRLIPSKLQDGWAFDLLQGVVYNVDATTMQKYFRDILMTLLNRLQTSRTDKYMVGLTNWLCYIAAIDVGNYGSDYVPQAVEGIQTGLWTSMLNNIIIPSLPKMPPKDRRISAIGLTRMLFYSSVTRSAPSWPAAFTGLLRLFSVFGQLDINEDDPDAGVTQIDYEEQTAGYQASYSKLSASENLRPDPASYAPDAKKFVMGELAKALQSPDRPAFQGLLQQCDAAVVQPFAAEMSSAGFRI